MFYVRSTDHGNRRKHQRCPTDIVFHSLLANFDREVDVGDGAIALSISDELREMLVEAGAISLEIGERLKGLAVVLQHADSDVCIKTVIRGRLDHRFGRYIRQRKKPGRVHRRHPH